MDNTQRANVAFQTLRHFAKLTRLDRSGDFGHAHIETAIADLLCDIRHLAHQRGFDLDAAIVDSRAVFAEELEDEADAA